MTSLKLAVFFTFLFFVKITFSYDINDTCLDLADDEGIEFSMIYQCSTVIKEIESKKGFMSSIQDPFLCSFINHRTMVFEDEEGEFSQNIEEITFYDVANKFMSSDYKTTRGNELSFLFIDQFRPGIKARSASIEMGRVNPVNRTARLTYTLFKNSMRHSAVQMHAEMECEIIQ